LAGTFRGAILLGIESAPLSEDEDEDVFQRDRSNKYFSEFYPQDGGKASWHRN